MDFITKLPRTARGVDTIWVIMDGLTKSAHFILIQESISVEKLAEIYVRESGTPWSACLGGVKLRCLFHFQILEAVPRQDGYSSPLQHRFHPKMDGQR